MMTDQKEDNKAPIDRVRDGALETAIWRRETDKGPIFNTERTRSYKDEDGNWHKTHSISERDLPKAALLDQRAYEKIQRLRDQERTQYIEEQQGKAARARDQDYGRER